MEIGSRNNRGAALVEFAIVAMLLVTLVLGIIDFGVLVWNHTTLNNAAREGARCAALGGDLTAIGNTVRSSASNLQDAASISVNVYHRVQDSSSNWPTTWTSGIPPTGTLASANVQVKVTAEYACNRPTGSLFGTNPITLRSDAVMRRE